jgi:hypothetical protein
MLCKIQFCKLKWHIEKSSLLCKDMTFGWSIFMANISHINMDSQDSFKHHKFPHKSEREVWNIRYFVVIGSFTHVLSFGGQVWSSLC